MKAVVYGHSQAQPTGMGDDMVAGLKKRGYSVNRVGLQGKNDKGLLDNIDVLGDISDADRVFLYAGGNSDKPTVNDLRALIQALGPDRTTVILPPVNLDRPTSAVVKQQAKNASNKAGIQDLVPVYTVAGHAADFKADSIHMRAGTAISKQLVNTILDAPAPQGSDLGDATDSTGDAADTDTAPTDESDYTLLWLVVAVVGGALLAKKLAGRK